MLGVLAGVAGCRGIPAADEKQKRSQLDSLRQVYRPNDERPPLPNLATNATLSVLLTFAFLNQPRIETAFYEYAAAVERITLERSLPDPRLTLELDIQDIVMTVMPGVMADLPWMRKLRIQADIASAESDAAYHAFVGSILRTAYEVKRPYYQLHFLTDRIAILKESHRLVVELEQIARAQTAAGKVTLQDVLRAQIEEERLRTEIVNLKESRAPMLAELKGALGISSGDPDPPFPEGFESTPLDITSGSLLASALSENPRLKQMEAEVRMAEAGIRLARQSRLPDYNLGVEADVKASPVMWRPTLGVTLPIWRDKIAAEISRAQSGKKVAAARLSSEQIAVAVELADKVYSYGEATRNLTLFAEALLPKARQLLDVTRANYSSGNTDFINVIDAERSLLEFRLAEVEARTRRELLLAELSLLIIGSPPPGVSLPVADTQNTSPSRGRGRSRR